MLNIVSYSEVGHMKIIFPWGSVLDPILFVICTASLHCLLDSLKVYFRFYADDTQIYMNLDAHLESQEKLTHIYEAVSQLMEARKKKLKPCKTEIQLIGTAHQINLVNEPSSFSLIGSEQL